MYIWRLIYTFCDCCMTVGTDDVSISSYGLDFKSQLVLMLRLKRWFFGLIWTTVWSTSFVIKWSKAVTKAFAHYASFWAALASWSGQRWPNSWLNGRSCVLEQPRGVLTVLTFMKANHAELLRAMDKRDPVLQESCCRMKPLRYSVPVSRHHTTLGWAAADSDCTVFFNR